MPFDLGAARPERLSAAAASKFLPQAPARDWIRSTTIQTMSLTRSLITQQHRPILDQLLVRLGLRQGQACRKLFVGSRPDWRDREWQTSLASPPVVGDPNQSSTRLIPRVYLCPSGVRWSPTYVYANLTNA